MSHLKKIFLIFVLIQLMLPGKYAVSQTAVSVTNVKRPSTAVGNKFYTVNRAPLAPLAFIKLPVGSIKAQGWILKYLELQRDGLTGHLGEISAWLDKKDNAWFSGNGKGDHGWEEVPYWLKGYGNLGYALKDEKIIAETKLWIKCLKASAPMGILARPCPLQILKETSLTCRICGQTC